MKKTRFKELKGLTFTYGANVYKIGDMYGIGTINYHALYKNGKNIGLKTVDELRTKFKIL
jgi:hypothetical protein